MYVPKCTCDTREADVKEEYIVKLGSRENLVSRKACMWLY